MDKKTIIKKAIIKQTLDNISGIVNDYYKIYNYVEIEEAELKSYKNRQLYAEYIEALRSFLTPFREPDSSQEAFNILKFYKQAISQFPEIEPDPFGDVELMAQFHQSVLGSATH